jgi:hypothetical protein
MTEKVSLFKATQIPDSFGVVLLVFFLILLLAPYFSGADFGVFRIPLFTDKAKKWLRIIGPILFILCVLSFIPIIPVASPPIPLEVYDDEVSQELYNNDTYVHVCRKGFAMLGADIEKNVFKCRRVIPQEGEKNVTSILDKSTRRADMHACPKGTYIRGLHANNDWLICSYDSLAGPNMSVSEFDRGMVGEFLGNISTRSYCAHGFMASALVVSRLEYKPSDLFFEWMVRLNVLPNTNQDTVLKFWIEHVNKAHNWYKAGRLR